MKRTPLRPRRRKPARVIESDLWREGLGPCAVHPDTRDCEGSVRGHHILTQQALRRRGLNEYLWDKRNRLAVCDGAHHRHHTRHAPIPRELLPEAAWEFAREVDLVWLLERSYPVKEEV